MFGFGIPIADICWFFRDDGTGIQHPFFSHPSGQRFVKGHWLREIEHERQEKGEARNLLKFPEKREGNAHWRQYLPETALFHEYVGVLLLIHRIFVPHLPPITEEHLRPSVVSDYH